MKKLLINITIALSLIIGMGINGKAESSGDTLLVSLTEEGKDIRDENPKGWRMPSRPIECTVDFSNLSITSERLSYIIYYELWDEAGEKIVVSYTNDYDMVVFMSALTGCYQLKLMTEETTYIGYIEL